MFPGGILQFRYQRKQERMLDKGVTEFTTPPPNYVSTLPGKTRTTYTAHFEVNRPSISSLNRRTSLCVR